MPTHYTEIRRTFDSPYTTAATDATTGQYRATPRSELTITIKLTVDSRAGLKSAVDELKTDLANDPDDANYDLIAVAGRRIGNGYAIVAVPFVKDDYPIVTGAGLGPPICTVSTQVRTRWLPVVEGNGSYSSTLNAAVFGGAVMQRPFKQFEAIIRTLDESTDSTLDLSGGTGVGKVNTSTWNGLAAKHVYYAGRPQVTGYEVAGGKYWRRHHVFVYRRWMEPQPKGIEAIPHDEVYVDESGVVQVTTITPAAIYNPFAP